MTRRNIARNRIISGIAGAVFGAIILGWPGLFAGAIMALCIHEIGAMIDAMGKKW